jgi:hypothetical protein
VVARAAGDAAKHGAINHELVIAESGQLMVGAQERSIAPGAARSTLEKIT